MPKRHPDPKVYRDEVLAPADPAEWRFELIVGEDDLEKLMTGRVSRDLMETAFRALSWKRSDQNWDDYLCLCPRCQKVKETA